MIESAIRLSVVKLRRECGLRLAPAWELDDARQAAALHYLETGDAFEAADRVWNEFRRNRRFHAKFNPGLPDDVESDTVRHDGIPDHYLSKCTNREREALCMAYECDMSGPELADTLGCTRRAANLLLVRGRAKVRKALA